MKEYSKIMNKIIDSDLPVHEKLTKLLNEASKYQIVDANKTIPKRGNARKGSHKSRIFNDDCI